MHTQIVSNVAQYWEGLVYFAIICSRLKWFQITLEGRDFFFIFTAAAGSAEVVIMLKNCGGQADGRAGKVLDTFIRVPSWVMHDTSCIMHHASYITEMNDSLDY